MRKAVFCAEDQDRTGDPSLFRGMLYQLSYLGKLFNELRRLWP